MKLYKKEEKDLLKKLANNMRYSEGILYEHNRWYFESIFGIKYVEENCNKSLEDFFNDAPQHFYMYITKKNVIITYGRHYISGIINKIIEKKITNMRAYEIFGIEMMENSIEKTMSVISKAEYRSKIISEI